MLNLFLASDDFCCLLIAFSNSLDPDWDLKNIGPDLDKPCDTLIVFLNFFEKFVFEKS